MLETSTSLLPLGSRLSAGLAACWLTGGSAQAAVLPGDLASWPAGLVWALGTLAAVGLAVGVSHWVHRRKAARLLAQQAHLASQVAHSGEAFVSETLEGVITEWTPAAAELFGHSASEAVGQRYRDLLFKDLPSDRLHLELVLHGEAISSEAVCRHRDGSLLEVCITSFPIPSSDGRTVVGIGKGIREMGTLKRAQRQLRELETSLEQQVSERTAAVEASRLELKNILDTVPSMIGYWDHALVNRVANSAYQRWFDAQAGAGDSRHMRDLLGEPLFEMNRPYIEAALRGKRQTFERSFSRPHGKGVRHVLGHYLPDIVDGEVRGFFAMVHDVTELTESRRKLATLVRENEALLSTIKSHSLYSVTDRAGRIIDVNDNFCDISGYAREELIGQNHRIINSGHHSKQFWTDMWQSVSQGKAWRGEVCNRSKDGTLYWVDSIIAPFLGADGQIEKYISMRTDITASKAASAALAEERERLDHILRGTNIGTWEWNVQTGEARFNERWAEMIGYTLEELGPVSIQTWFDHIHPEDLAPSEALLSRHFTRETDYYESEIRIQHRDGRWVWVLARGRVSSWTAEGLPERMYGTHQDISRSIEAQRRLAASEAFLERAGRLAGVGGWQLDVDSGELTWSGETQRIHELPSDYRLVLQEAIQYYAPEARPIIENAVRRAMEHGEGWDLELPLITAKGRSIWVRTVGEVEYASDAPGQRPVRLVCALQDVTARRAAEDAVDAKRAAEAASAAKSAFLATMSHEIRTPLNATIGLCYLLDHTALQADQRDFLRKIQVANRSLLGVINDVLDLAKIEAGEIALESRPFELTDIFEELSDVLGPQAQRKRLVLYFDTPDDLPQRVQGDATRVGQILMNLLSNAIKFTETGRVELSGRLVRTDDAHHHLEFVVRDTGIGISPEVQERLFMPFVQADAATTRRFGGTGLGLSIVWQLAQLMGGEVGVRSQLGQGSEFWAHLPLGVVPADDQHGDGLPSRLRVGILAASPRQGRMLGNLARALGWQVEMLTADSLQAEPSAAGSLPLDVMLVEGAVAGTATALRARAIGRNHRVPTVAVHPVDDTPVLLEASADVVDSWIPCPYVASDLFNAVNQAIARQEGSTDRVLKATRVEPWAAEWLPGVRVMVVDDSEINREVALRILQREGAVVETCSGGQEALDRLRHSGDDPFDAVLMDVQMPDVDGNAATRRIRAELGLHDLPVIALTAGALTSERQNAIESGMNDFVSKPLDPRWLIRTIRRHVERVRHDAIPLRLRDEEPASAADLAWPSVEGIDSNDAATRFGSDTPLFVTLLGRLLREYADLANAPLSLPDSEAASTALMARLHKLKGNAGMLGALTLHPQAAEAERVLRSGRPVEELVPWLTAIGESLRTLAQASAGVRAAQAEAQQRALDADGLGVPVNEAELSALADMLRRQDLSALERFKSLAASLRAAWGAERLQRLQEAMDNLSFQDALGILQEQPEEAVGSRLPGSPDSAIVNSSAGMASESTAALPAPLPSASLGLRPDAP
ncbi:MAG: PAS domain S-box protein [Pseudomonadota bacterium]